ncbi:hypothetical protein GALMADRAFT_255029 [Galerina marginata CBS 339.88]|uniref:C2H2-type domain-containing protein n=1 Tax=Galerina marginata (strain CBS 339.88) TaxID=685588 RepID=A0A067SGU9_GALM3|nr:hypothetical protein GALMADRAFT_255029 [Galerina marginata CBS 339.88]
MPAERSSATKRARIAHTDPSDPCEVCGQVISRNSDMPRHMKTHDTTEKTPCPYEGCDFRTVQKSNLETHMRRHTKEKIFPCNDDIDCSFSTCDSASLLRHRKKLHGYVPRPTALRKKAAPEPRPKDQTSRRNPHRIPVSVIRSVKDESDAPVQALSQFSSFSSGAISTPASTSRLSTPVDSLSDLSDLSDLTDSEGESDLVASTPSGSFSPSSASSASSSLPPVGSNTDTTVFFVNTPQLYLPQDVVSEVPFYPVTKQEEQFLSSDLQWLWERNSAVAVKCDAFMFPEPSYSPIQPAPTSISRYDPEHQPSFVHQASPGYLTTGFNGSPVYPSSPFSASSSSSSADGFFSPSPLPELQLATEVPEPVSAYNIQDADIAFDVETFQYSPSTFVKQEPEAIGFNFGELLSQHVAHNVPAESNADMMYQGAGNSFDFRMEEDASFPEWFVTLGQSPASETVW